MKAEEVTFQPEMRSLGIVKIAAAVRARFSLKPGTRVRLSKNEAKYFEGLGDLNEPFSDQCQKIAKYLKEGIAVIIELPL